MTGGITFGGWDLALNHSGAVLLDLDGNLVDFRYRTNQRSSARRDEARSWYHKPGGPADLRDIERLADNALWQRSILRAWRPGFSYVEGYAFGTPKGELTGEIAGAWKLQCWSAGMPYRIMDVASVKMYAAHHGGASKDMVRAAVRDRWDQDFEVLNKPWTPRQRKDRDKNLLWLDEAETIPDMTGEPKDLRQTEEDLCDAYTLARMCRAEYLIRTGIMTLAELEDDAERRVFLRTTKVHPENVLARPWTVRE